MTDRINSNTLSAAVELPAFNLEKAKDAYRESARIISGAKELRSVQALDARLTDNPNYMEFSKSSLFDGMAHELRSAVTIEDGSIPVEPSSARTIEDFQRGTVPTISASVIVLDKKEYDRLCVEMRELRYCLGLAARPAPFRERVDSDDKKL